MISRIVERIADSSLSARIQMITIGVSGFALLVGSLMFIAIEVVNYRDQLQQRVAATSRVVATNVQAAVVFDDAFIARNMLDSVGSDEAITWAAITLPDGNVFVSYSSDGDDPLTDQFNQFAFAASGSVAALRGERAVFSRTHLDARYPILLKGEEIGSVNVRADLSDFYSAMLAMCAQIGMVFAVLMCAVWWATKRLRQQVSRPLQDLAEGMQMIAMEQDYSVRLLIPEGHEVRELTEWFNHMIEQIQSRDKELDEHRQGLERQVTERTAQLVEARDAAEAGSRAKSEFLATMSHEIRTPMNGVLGMTELLLASGLDRRQQHLADAAHRSAEGLLAVINDILDFSKIEADKLELEHLEFDVLSVCEDALEIVSDPAHRKGLVIVPDIAQDVPLLLGDGPRLRQVLLNLLSNAVKFTERGEITLSLKWTQADAGRIGIEVAVSDTGVGIAAEELPTIFSAFSQIDGSTSRSHEGTGLGLAISSRIVAMMGGELHADSVHQQGSSFSFTVYLEKSANQERLLVADQRLNGMRVLVVDDHGINRAILQGRLVAWGMRSDSAASGAEAIDLLQQAASEGDPYRLALFDWHMPNMDGIQLATKVHADPRIPELGVLVLSSTIAAMDTPVSDQVVNRFLAKPVRRAELMSNMLALVAKGAGADPVGAGALRLQGRVLLAEDNEVNQEVACAALEVAGCEVVLASNGIEAVAAARSERLDLILMDCHMPQMDGFEATTAIRALSNDNARLPIIALTADVRKGIDEHCREVGMDGYLSKPFTQDALASLLTTWLPQAQLQTSDTSARSSVISALEYLDASVVQQLQDLGARRGKDLIGRTVQLYSAQVPELLCNARDALSAGDLAGCAAAIHSLKSASGNIGATALAQLCADVESTARGGLEEGLEARLDDIEAAFAQLEPELASLRALKTDAGHGGRAVQASAGPQVLVADDDPSIRLTLSEALAAQGYTVDGAEDGQEVLRKVKRNPPDLILLDAQMPGMDGFEACQRMHEDPALCHIPVMMITGLDDVASINRAFAVGASTFVQKPVNLTVLVEDVRFLLRSSRDSAQLRATHAQLEVAQRLSRIGYWQWRIERDEFRCSTQLDTIFGYPAGTIGEDRSRFIQVVREEDRGLVSEAFNQAAQTGAVPTLEYRVLTEQGHELLVRQEVEVNFDSAGNRTVFGAIQDISLQRAAEEKIRKLAYYDPLTALASRSYFMQRIEEMIKSAKRRDDTFAVLFMDLDGFKDVNDSLGHDVGDRLLEIIAQRLRAIFRDNDFIARLGGDEFCVLMENLSDTLDVAKVVERCLSEIEVPVDLGVQTVRPHMSIGIARFPDDGATAHGLIKAADSAMYAAKKNGKHRYEYFSAGMTELAERRLALVSDLREAFHRDEFLLHFQPLVDLASGRTVGVEALARWQHPERGMLPPVEFISEVERIGMIGELGNWVLEQACVLGAGWCSEHPELEVAVNTSPAQFLVPNFAHTVRQTLERSGLAPSNLVLEVTENMFQGHSEVSSTIATLREMGVRIALDDFGTGYSSLGSIHALPVDILKIDRLFVKDLLSSPKDAIMLGSIMSMSRALSLEVVAEGVEELGQVQILQSMGCDVIQGFFFSRPVAADDVQALLERNFLDLLVPGQAQDLGGI